MGPLGGATPTNLFADLGNAGFANPQANYFALTPVGIQHLQAGLTDADQHTELVSNSLSWSSGKHQFKFGGDFRHINSTESPFDREVVPVFHTLQSILTGVTNDIGVQDDLATDPVYSEYSAYAQDEWRISQKLTFSPGVRWDYDPAPAPGNGVQLFTLLGNPAVPSTLSIVPVQENHPLFTQGHGSFAPRLGAAWQLHQQPGRETVLRAGGGVYFDTLNQPALFGFGNTESTNYTDASLPLTPAQLNVGPASGIPPVPPYNPNYIDPHIQLPYTIEWNVSLQQALGNSQAITLAYVASAARRLFTTQYLDLSQITTDYQIVTEVVGTSSSYDSGQLQYQRNLQRGVQALASYTWAHTIDTGSANGGFNYARGNASTDIGHIFQSGLSWSLPNVPKYKWLDATLSHWGLDGRWQVRSSAPVTLGGQYFQVGSLFGQAGVNLVPGQQEYLHGRQYPGKKALNPAAFVTADVEAIGTLPRNQLRDFPLDQLNLAARREFPLVENLRLQFRLETFNLLNHPAFTGIDTTVGDPTFGIATNTLNQAGPRTSLYETGGPRSLQFVVKILF